MGPECIRSFNGYRSTIELLKLVPNTEVMILIFALIFRLRSPTTMAKTELLYLKNVGAQVVMDFT